MADDQSSEEEWQQAKSYEALDTRIKVIRREEGVKGPSACRNLGVKHANGKYLIFLDSDDLLAPFCVQQREQVMEQHPELSGAVFLMQNFEKYPGDLKTFFNNDVPENRLIDAFLQNENPWQTMAPIWRKEAFERTGGFDEKFLFMEDPDLHLRGLYGGEKFKTFYDNPPDCFYRVHHFDETKKDFYYNSILYRILFYQKVTSGYYDKTFVNTHRQSIKAGVNHLIKTFLYSRKNQFPELYKELMEWMYLSGLYSRLEINRYRFLLNTGNSENKILKKLKIKGACYRML